MDKNISLRRETRLDSHHYKCTRSSVWYFSTVASPIWYSHLRHAANKNVYYDLNKNVDSMYMYNLKKMQEAKDYG